MRVGRVASAPDHREPAACEPERVVEAVDVGAEPLGDRQQGPVGGESADLRVERREAVDVDEQEEERALGETRPSDLVIEDGLEGVVVVEPGEQVELGHHVGLAQVERPRDRRAGARHELVERGDVVLAEPAALVTGEDAEEAP